MKNLFKLQTLALAGAFGAVLLLPMAQAATLSKNDYSAAKSRISSDYSADKAACSGQTGNAKDVCVQEAKAKEKVARAELEFGYSGKAKDGTRVAVAKAESVYAVAKERCDDQKGSAKDVCRKEAKAVEAKALADAKLSRQVGEARTDAAQTKRDANYKVATEKCEALSGDAKSQCMSTAKSSFGKS